ncbi:hypothetical protein [Argonema antarcticum]|nr:hypothetical protein [Argonema antarcticum]
MSFRRGSVITQKKKAAYNSQIPLVLASTLSNLYIGGDNKPIN